MIIYTYYVKFDNDRSGSFEIVCSTKIHTDGGQIGRQTDSRKRKSQYNFRTLTEANESTITHMMRDFGEFSEYCVLLIFYICKKLFKMNSVQKELKKGVFNFQDRVHVKVLGPPRPNRYENFG